MKFESMTLSHSEKIGLVSNLSTMLSAGIPILEAVDSLLADARGNAKRILVALREDLVQGKHIWTTLHKFPRVFDLVTVSVIRASEEAGTLDITLKDLKTTIQKEVEFTDKVRTAMLYPAFITVVFLAVLIMILTVVVPKIATVFARLKADLPLPTKILIGLSNLLVNETPWVIIILLGGGLLVVFLYKQKRDLVNEVLFSLPFISTLVTEIDITRFTRSLHLLLSAGLPITTALELTQNVVIRRKTARLIAESRQSVLAGQMLSTGFRTAKGYFPTIMIKLMEAGERTGTLDRSMQDISEYFDYEVTTTLKTFTSLLEPILLVAVGVVVGGMMLSIIAPVYNLIGQVGAR